MKKEKAEEVEEGDSKRQRKSEKLPPNLPLTLVIKGHYFRHPMCTQRKRLLVRNGIIPDVLFLNNDIKFNLI